MQKYYIWKGFFFGVKSSDERDLIFEKTEDWAQTEIFLSPGGGVDKGAYQGHSIHSMASSCHGWSEGN